MLTLLLHLVVCANVKKILNVVVGSHKSQFVSPKLSIETVEYSGGISRHPRQPVN